MIVLNIVLSLAFFFAVLLAIVMWAIIWRRWRAGQEIVPYEPREPAPVVAIMRGMVLVVVLLLLKPLSLLMGGAADPAKPPAVEELVQLLTSSLVSSAVMLVLLLALLKLGTGANWRQLGWSARHVRGDVLLGVAAYLAVFLPIYGIQMFLSRWFPEQHLIVKVLQENSDWRVFALSFVAAVIVAPIYEEWMFRFVLQSGLQHYFDRDKSHHGDLTMYYSDQSSISHVQSSPAVEPSTWYRWLPVILSSLVFALAHLGDGPAPIPLFFLALVLGYLYRQTGRVLPSIVVHFCLNGTSLMMLGIATLVGEPPQGLTRGKELACRGWATYNPADRNGAISPSAGRNVA